jgi:hypothetical protein
MSRTLNLLVCCTLLLVCANGARGAFVDFIRTDLETDPIPSGQQTQATWAHAGVIPSSLALTIPLPLTAAGTLEGITATLAGDSDGWESRGGPAALRAQVTGTSFDDLVEDLVATRDGSATILLTGLDIGRQYTLTAWHNDSINSGAGFATGGGTVTPSVIGGTINSANNGLLHNLLGAQTDSAFTLTQLLFTATNTSSSILLTSSNPNGFLPINALQFAAEDIPVPAPEPTSGFLALAGLMAFVRVRRAHR